MKQYYKPLKQTPTIAAFNKFMYAVGEPGNCRKCQAKLLFTWITTGQYLVTEKPLPIVSVYAGCLRCGFALDALQAVEAIMSQLEFEGLMADSQLRQSRLYASLTQEGKPKISVAP